MKYILLLTLLFIFTSCREALNENPSETQKAFLPGKLYIYSVPDNAHIFVNGSDSGKKTQDSLINLYPGSYNIRLYYDALRDTTMKVEVVSGRTKYIYVNIKARTI